MTKAKIISATMSFVGLFMIALAFVIEDSEKMSTINLMKSDKNDVDVINMSLSNRVVKTKIEKNDSEKIEELKMDDINKKEEVEEVSMEQSPQAEYIPPRVEVYEGMTMEELSDKLNRNLGTGAISGKGNLIATKSIELGVDPYVATAIMLHETGCKYNCSKLVVACNNVGGQKGSPACSGSYKGYNSIDEGIVGHIENLSRYYSQGLNTVSLIGPRYAQSSTWVSKINWYIDMIRNS